MLHSDRLKKLRKSKKLTQADVANSIDIARSTYVRYEKGEVQPSTGTVVVIAELFNVTTDYLLGISNDLIPPGEVQLMDGLEFAFHQDYRELDDDDREELNRAASRMLELKRLKGK